MWELVPTRSHKPGARMAGISEQSLHKAQALGVSQDVSKRLALPSSSY